MLVAPTLAPARHNLTQPTASSPAPFGLSPTPPRRFAPGRRGRRFCEPQEHSPSTAPFCGIRPQRPPRAACASLRPRTAILRIALSLRRCLRHSNAGSLYPVLRPRAFGKSCQNAQVHFDDFPLKASARCRSALEGRPCLPQFESPAAILAGLAHRQSAEYALFKRAGDC